MVLAIVALGTVVLGSVVVWQSSFYAQESKRIDVLEAHNAALEAMSRDIRTGRSIATTYGEYTSSTTTLVIALPVLGGEDDDAASDYVIYRASSTQLRRVVVADEESERISGDRVIDVFLDTVAFDYDGTPPDTQAVTITIGSKGITRGVTHTANDAIIIRLRNK